jgi:mRNA interferase MazF
MKEIKQYEIWMADLNPPKGTEPGKVRPVCILQTNLLNNIHPSTIILPITTNVNPNAEILRVHLKKGEGGLQENSDILIDQIRAIDNKRLIQCLGTINPKTAEVIERNIKILLNIGEG